MRKFKKEVKRDPTKEYPDTTPIEVPAELKRPESMEQKMKRIVKEQISVGAAAKGYESFEEASDFDVEDSFEGDNLLSPYDVNEMVEEFPAGSPELPEKEGEESVMPAGSDPSKEKKDEPAASGEAEKEVKGEKNDKTGRQVSNHTDL
jgi:hypothetical protein